MVKIRLTKQYSFRGVHAQRYQTAFILIAAKYAIKCLKINMLQPYHVNKFFYFLISTYILFDVLRALLRSPSAYDGRLVLAQGWQAHLK